MKRKMKRITGHALNCMRTKAQRLVAMRRMMQKRRAYKVKRAIDAIHWPDRGPIDVDTLLGEIEAA